MLSVVLEVSPHHTCPTEKQREHPNNITAYNTEDCLNKVTFFFNPYHVEFLKWNSPPYIFGTVHYHFRDIKMRT